MTKKYRGQYYQQFPIKTTCKKKTKDNKKRKKKRRKENQLNIAQCTTQQNICSVPCQYSTLNSLLGFGKCSNVNNISSV